MVYRLLALDIDGTLLNNSNRLDRRTKDAVQYARKKGVVVTLVSERHFHSAAKVARLLRLTHPIITHNGAFVSSSMDNPVYTSKIEHSVLLQLVEFLETYPCQIQVSHERLSISNRPRQKNLIAKMTIGMNEPLFYPVTYVDTLSQYLLENYESATDVKVKLKDEKVMNDIEQAIDDYFPSLAVSRPSIHDITLVRQGTSKFNGLLFFAGQLGIPLHEIVAVGDGPEDAEMIEKAGLGVAMRNASPDVKAKADWVTRTNEMDGVAYVVREVFRKQLRVH
ncbi:MULTISPECIES: Cof-type HAD-IIB family hydrolase [unclassified Sporolactobacillus]|uniref:Cof-type HAD-IIB family hydrolase n=1 Tax=unclassified Sporolactobacillus TaxID=2628533 RepID=UPI0023677ADF|nr:Cof-type HAD-IIB family hydrolase [Sporolactobacillus sp. CQH2019]MDD9149424.1 Cof-type HAD-IIB family hydrolase [Sporolactobacillus sp. CQH2019]